MPKLNNRPPKYCKMGKYAVVYYAGKPRYLGLHGSPESKIAYARFIAELQANPVAVSLPSEENRVTVRELTAAFLDYAKAKFDRTEYAHCRIIVLDFLEKLYGDNFPVDDFKPKCLKLVREDMIKSRRFCRRIVNRYTHRIVSIFAWGVEQDIVLETSWRALHSVKALRKGEEGTFDNPPREEISDEVVKRTLPFLPPMLRAMVIVQRLTGMRPSEVFNMRVGEIIKDTAAELWHYKRTSHKTERFTGKQQVIPLGKFEQELIEPYLVGKAAEQAVFSPQTAQAERNAEKRTARKSKLTPSQIARDKARQPRNYKETYDENSYRKAVEFAIKKGNKVLPDEQKIPPWTPYQLRHAAITRISFEKGKDAAQALAGHSSSQMTDNYDHSALRKREQLARERQNPFEAECG